MKRILLLSPSQRLAEDAEKIIDEQSLDVEVCFSTVPDIHKNVMNAVAQGVRVIISRRGMARIIKQMFDIPVITIEFTSNSYVRIFECIKGIKGKIAFFSLGDVPGTVKILGAMLNLDIRYYYFTDEATAEMAVKNAAEDGCIIGVGGSLTVLYSGKYNLEYHILDNSREDIEMALDSAHQVLKSTLAEEKRRKSLQVHIQRYETIFNYTHDGIIAVDRDGIIEVVNKQASDMLGLGDDSYKGKYIEEMLPETKLMTTLRNGEVELDELMRVGNDIIITNRVPIKIDNRVEGVVATFRDIDSVRVSEQKIRSNLRKKGIAAKYRFSDIIGESVVLKRTLRIAKSYAKTDAPILLVGEIGTGKEIFSHAIHQASARRNAPFVTVHCMHSQSDRLLAELYGVEGDNKGNEIREGAFELAHGGTLFLDMIDAASEEIQSQILRVIESKEVRRLGGKSIIPIDVRIIASVHANILEEIREGKFLEELTYAINTLTLKLPPLRQRDRDYYLLCEYGFRKKLKEEFNRYREDIRVLEDFFADYPWRGNVRELFNLVERASILLENRMSAEEIIMTFPANGAKESSSVLNDVTLGKWNKSSIVEALSLNKLNVSRTARQLGCSRSTLYKKMEELNIKVTNIK